MLRIELEGIDEVERDWRDAMRALSDGTRRGVDRACDEGSEEARRTHRYTDRTEVLTRSIRGHVLVSTPGGAEGDVVATAPYASFVENGTRPHIIQPRRRRWLAWEPADAPGEWHFAKEVHHPGAAPHLFMAQAYLKAERVLVREVERAAEDAQHIMDR